MMTFLKPSAAIIGHAIVGMTALLALSAVSAQAQTATTTIPVQTASYSATMAISGADRKPVISQIYSRPGGQRIEIPTEQYGPMVSLINTADKAAYSFGKDPAGALGVNARQISYGPIASRMGADLSPATLGISPVIKIGNSVVERQSCTLYQMSLGTACITADGITMQLTSTDGGQMTLSKLRRGTQPDALFSIPKNYLVIDTRKGIPTLDDDALRAGPNADPNAVRGFIVKQAGKQTKKQIKKMTRKQIGDTIGGLIGGSIVGGTIGSAAGDMVSGTVDKMMGNGPVELKAAPLELTADQTTATVTIDDDVED